MARKICKCIVMMEILTKLGATHAAEMHRKGGKVDDASNTDLLTHFLEEERYVLPLLPPDVSKKIFDEHEMFRAQIKVFGKIKNEALFNKHADYEDKVVIQYLGHLIDWQKLEREVYGMAAVAGRSRVSIVEKKGRRFRSIERA
jgi:hypothetical protein